MRGRSINLGWGQYWLGWASLQRGHHLSTGPFSLAQDTRDKCFVCKQRRICVYRITDSLFGIYKSWKHGVPRRSRGSSVQERIPRLSLKYSLFDRDVISDRLCAVSFSRISSANAFIHPLFFFEEKSIKRRLYYVYSFVTCILGLLSGCNSPEPSSSDTAKRVI